MNPEFMSPKIREGHGNSVRVGNTVCVYICVSVGVGGCVGVRRPKC